MYIFSYWSYVAIYVATAFMQLNYWMQYNLTACIFKIILLACFQIFPYSIN